MSEGFLQSALGERAKDIFDRATSVRLPEEKPSEFSSFVRGIDMTSIYGAVSRFIQNDSPDVPGYNPVRDENIRGLEGFEDDLVQVRSPQQFQAFKQKVLREKQNNEIIAANPIAGLLGSVFTGFGSPDILIPGGIALRGGKAATRAVATASRARRTANILSAGAKLGAETALLSTVEESILTSESVTQDIEQAVNNVGTSFLFGAFLGSGIRFAGIRGEQVAEVGNSLLEELIVGDRINLSLESLERANRAGALPNRLAQALQEARPEMFRLIGERRINKIVRGIIRQEPLRFALSHSKTARVLGKKFFDVPFLTRADEAGVSLGESVTIMAQRLQAPVRIARATLKNVYRDLRMSGNRFFNNQSDLNVAIGMALRRNETASFIPDADARAAVESAASDIRRNVLDPLKREAIEAGFLDPDEAVKFAESHLFRVLDQDALATVEGQRTFLQLAEDSLVADGKSLDDARKIARDTLNDIRRSPAESTHGTVSPFGSLAERRLPISDVDLENAGLLISDIDAILHRFGHDVAGQLALVRALQISRSPLVRGLRARVQSGLQKIRQNGDLDEVEVLRRTINNARAIQALEGEFDIQESVISARQLEVITEESNNLIRQLRRGERTSRSTRRRLEKLESRVSSMEDRLRRRVAELEKKRRTFLSQMRKAPARALQGLPRRIQEQFEGILQSLKGPFTRGRDRSVVIRELADQIESGDIDSGVFAPIKRDIAERFPIDQEARSAALRDLEFLKKTRREIFSDIRRSPVASFRSMDPEIRQSFENEFSRVTGITRASAIRRLIREVERGELSGEFAGTKALIDKRFSTDTDLEAKIRNERANLEAQEQRVSSLREDVSRLDESASEIRAHAHTIDSRVRITDPSGIEDLSDVDAVSRELLNATSDVKRRGMLELLRLTPFRNAILRELDQIRTQAREAGDDVLARQIDSEVRDLLDPNNGALVTFQNRILGRRNNAHSPAYLPSRIIRGVKKLGVVQSLGQIVLGSINDFALPLLRNSIGSFVRGVFLALGTGRFRNLSQDTIVRNVEAIELVSGSMRANTLATIQESRSTAGFFDKAVDKFFDVSGFRWWQRAGMSWSAIVASDDILRASIAAVRGNITNRQVRELALSGVSLDDARGIGRLFDEFGDDSGDILLSRAIDWPDTAEALRLRDVLESAVFFRVNNAIFRPTTDLARFFNSEFMSIFGMFRSFAFSSINRIMIPGLQRPDINFLSYAAASFGLGYIGLQLRRLARGREFETDPAKIAVEVIDRSGIIGVLGEVPSIADTVLGGKLSPSGRLPQAGPFFFRGTFLERLSPFFGTIEKNAEAARGIGALLTGEASSGDISAIRRIIWGQNISYLDWLFSLGEDFVKENFAVDRNGN